MGRTASGTRWPSSGMGCTKFAELWDKGARRPHRRRLDRGVRSAGVEKDDIDAYWFGTAQSGMSGIALARPLQLKNKPVTRVENYCTTGSEALRGAVYAVASGAYDVAMAVGAEKVKDSGYQGLNADEPAGRRHGADVDGGGHVLHGGSGVRAKVRRRRRDDGRGAGVDRRQEPLQRGAQPTGAVPPGDHEGDRAGLATAGRHPRRVRLRRCGRRRGGGDRRAGRGRAALHGQALVYKRPVVRGRERVRA